MYPRDRTSISSWFCAESCEASELSRFLHRKYQQHISRFLVGLIQICFILRQRAPYSLSFGQCHVLCIIGLDDEKSEKRDLQIFIPYLDSLLKIYNFEKYNLPKKKKICLCCEIHDITTLKFSYTRQYKIG